MSERDVDKYVNKGRCPPLLRYTYLRPGDVIVELTRWPNFPDQVHGYVLLEREWYYCGQWHDSAWSWKYMDLRTGEVGHMGWSWQPFRIWENSVEPLTASNSWRYIPVGTK